MNAQFDHSKRIMELMPKLQATGMQTFDRICCLATHAFAITPIDGAMCEFGCNSGVTSALLREIQPGRELWCYDTFEGMPQDGGPNSWKKGDMKVKAGDSVLPNDAMIVRCDLSQLALDDSALPMKIALAHVDVDEYEATLNVLRVVFPKLHQLGVVIVDDYFSDMFPGPRKAVDEFIVSHGGIDLEKAYGCDGQLRASVVLTSKY